ncbi:MAG: NPCBM/NEW2 domain-containing protein [Pirellulales bacterium]
MTDTRFVLKAAAVAALLVPWASRLPAQPPEPNAQPAATPVTSAPQTAARPVAKPNEQPLVTPALEPAFRGTLVAAVDQPAWQVRFEAADGPRHVEIKELALWGAFLRPAAGVWVVLAGGGVMVVDAVGIVEDQLVANSPLTGNFAVPLRLVAGIVLQTPADRTASDRLIDRVLSLSGQVDRVILENGDELTGTITSFDGATLRLKSDDNMWDLPLAKLATVLFNSILIDKPNPAGLRVVVGLQDGSRMTALSLVSEDKTARLKLIGGVDVSLPLESIVALQPLGGSVVYLSDMKPASYRHIPFLDLSWPFGADRSVQQAMLSAGGKLYLKGLGMHSPSRITYELDEPFQRFDAEVAIDTEAGRRGSVVFRVFTDDGSGAWQERATSQIVRGGEPPVQLSADLSGARRISLLVDFADRGDEQDHADWLNARLIRQ